MELQATMAAYSDDLRTRVLEAVLNEKMSHREAAERFRVGKSWVGKIVLRFRQTGDAAAYLPIGGPGPALGEAEREQMAQWLREQPDQTQQQLADRFEEQGRVVDRSTVGRTLRAMGWTRKKSRWWPPSSSATRSSPNAPNGSSRSSPP